MNEKTLTRVEIRQKGISALQRELGIPGFIEFMQDFGLNAGDYTQERNRWLTEKTVDEVVHKIKPSI
jgi:hypothetical protein